MKLLLSIGSVFMLLVLPSFAFAFGAVGSHFNESQKAAQARERAQARQRTLVQARRQRAQAHQRQIEEQARQAEQVRQKQQAEQRLASMYSMSASLGLELTRSYKEQSRLRKETDRLSKIIDSMKKQTKCDVYNNYALCPPPEPQPVCVGVDPTPKLVGFDKRPKLVGINFKPNIVTTPICVDQKTGEDVPCPSGGPPSPPSTPKNPSIQGEVWVYNKEKGYSEFKGRSDFKASKATK